MNTLLRLSAFFCCILGLKSVCTQNLPGLKPCPALPSAYTKSIDQLLGDWHIAFLILDKSDEFTEEQSLCIQGRLLKMNQTTVVQIWKIALPELLHEEKTEVEFFTKIIEPGIWLVKSPLGGELRGTVLESDGKSYLLIVYCGYHKTNSVHFMTLAMARSHIVTPKQRLEFMSLLVKHGYDPYRDKIVNWSDCRAVNKE